MAKRTNIQNICSLIKQKEQIKELICRMYVLKNKQERQKNKYSE